jgi:uncharacterized membrane protein YhaH (DUF805 family)
MHWYLDVLKKYAVFQGRAGRKEYWYFALFNIYEGLSLAQNHPTPTSDTLMMQTVFSKFPV